MQKIHKTKRDNISKNSTDAFDFSIVNIILTITYPNKIVPGNMNDVNKDDLNQFFPPHNL